MWYSCRQRQGGGRGEGNVSLAMSHDAWSMSATILRRPRHAANDVARRVPVSVARGSKPRPIAGDVHDVSPMSVSTASRPLHVAGDVARCDAHIESEARDLTSELAISLAMYCDVSIKVVMSLCKHTNTKLDSQGPHARLSMQWEGPRMGLPWVRVRCFVLTARTCLTLVAWIMVFLDQYQRP